MDTHFRLEDLSNLYLDWMRDQRAQKDEAWKKYYEQCFRAVERAFGQLPSIYECLTCEEKDLRGMLERVAPDYHEVDGKRVHNRNADGEEIIGVFKIMATANSGASGQCKDPDYQERIKDLLMPHGAELSDMKHVIDFYQEGVMLLRNISHAIQTGNHDTKAVLPEQIGEIPSPYVVAIQDSDHKLESMFTQTMSSLCSHPDPAANRRELDEAGYPIGEPGTYDEAFDDVTVRLRAIVKKFHEIYGDLSSAGSARDPSAESTEVLVSLALTYQSGLKILQDQESVVLSELKRRARQALKEESGTVTLCGIRDFESLEVEIPKPSDRPLKSLISFTK
jgi:hypothetical protein